MNNLQKELEKDLDDARIIFLEKNRILFDFLDHKHKNKGFKYLDIFRDEYTLMVFKVLIINFVTVTFHKSIKYNEDTICDDIENKINKFLNKLSSDEIKKEISQIIRKLVANHISYKDLIASYG